MHQQQSKNTNVWDRMDALMSDSVEPEGDEWFTRVDLEKRYDISQATAGRRLRDLKAEGRLDEWRGGMKGAAGNACKYRLKTT